jgi:hypothetical protein
MAPGSDKRQGKGRSGNTAFVFNPEEIISLGELMHRLENNIKINIKERWCESGD